jgi:large subunit ribosomal protein L9
MAAIEVILKEPIQNLGAEADVVKVAAGFARNYLVPQGKAYYVTAGNLRRLNELKTKRAQREAKELNEAEELARRINKMRMQLTLETGGTGKAFGAITANDIAEKLRGELGGKEIDRHKITLEQPIKTTGEHEVVVKVHADVSARLKVIVKPADEGKAEGAEAEEKPRKSK